VFAQYVAEHSEPNRAFDALYLERLARTSRLIEFRPGLDVVIRARGASAASPSGERSKAVMVMVIVRLPVNEP